MSISNSYYMKNKIEIYKTIIQLSMTFSPIAFYYECCKSGRIPLIPWLFVM